MDTLAIEIIVLYLIFLDMIRETHRRYIYYQAQQVCKRFDANGLHYVMLAFFYKYLEYKLYDFYYVLSWGLYRLHLNNYIFKLTPKKFSNASLNVICEDIIRYIQKNESIHKYGGILNFEIKKGIRETGGKCILRIKLENSNIPENYKGDCKYAIYDEISKEIKRELNNKFNHFKDNVVVVVCREEIF
ncbi:hypothetical protein [Methanococcus voltae]|uniref:Uncharacterized protein n=1 Tax=Methanococcus voltae (strain ATCC BAA-1334 / A3) TaxID=456320 RepID=D7DSH2_METV3|nr:hypothetical protein [Methanococcus voltae]MCS3901608.1 hypothetical protein [Methanococcus voltae]